MGRFRAGNVRLRASYDPEFTERLSKNAQLGGVRAGTLGERECALDHGTMIPLYFLNRVYTDYRLVRIGLSGLPPLEHYRLGQCLAKTAEELGRRVVILASGDLSHKLKDDGPYGFAPEGPEFDAQVTAALGEGNFRKLLEFQPDFADAAAECGLRSFQIMAGALDRKAVTHRLLSYEGPFGVGYGVAAFEVTGADAERNFGDQFEAEEQKERERRRENEDGYVRLARLSLETYIRSGRRAGLPEGLPREMTEARAGVFVSLKENGQLRGCIGTISAATGSVAEEIMLAVCGTKETAEMRISSDSSASVLRTADVLNPNFSSNARSILICSSHAFSTDLNRTLPLCKKVSASASPIASNRRFSSAILTLFFPPTLIPRKKAM